MKWKETISQMMLSNMWMNFQKPWLRLKLRLKVIGSAVIFPRPTEKTAKLEELQGEVRAQVEKLKMTDAVPVETQSIPAGRGPEVTIRREFRTSGQIGEGG